MHETWETSIQSPNRYVGFFRESYTRMLKRRSLFLNDSGREAYFDRWKKREYCVHFAVSNSTEWRLSLLYAATKSKLNTIQATLSEENGRGEALCLLDYLKDGTLRSTVSCAGKTSLDKNLNELQSQYQSISPFRINVSYYVLQESVHRPISTFTQFTNLQKLPTYFLSHNLMPNIIFCSYEFFQLKPQMKYVK